MAERRMFSKAIIDSDAFLDMPLSTQALYFHLSMRADDEGFVGNPKKIQRMIGASDDDCRILISKRFILTFQSGIIVIKHWLIHNYIRGDRIHETTYLEEKSTLTIDGKGAYTERKNSDVSQLTDKCQSNVSQLTDSWYTEDSIEQVNKSTLLLKKDSSYIKNSLNNKESNYEKEIVYLDKGECKGEKEKKEKEREKEREKEKPFTAESLKYDIDTFCSRFGVMLDSYNFRIDEIDFKLLTERFEESEWLKKNVSSFKKICDIYPKIASGFYKNYDRKPRKDKAFEKLQKMLAEAEEEEQKEKLNEKEEIKDND